MFHGLKKVNFLQIDVYKFNTSPIKVLRKKKIKYKRDYSKIYMEK